MTQIAALHAYEVAVDVVVGYLEPCSALPVGVGVEATPSYHLFIELALAEEKCACCLTEEGMLKEPDILFGVECPFGRRRLVVRYELLHDDVVFVSKPLTSLYE